MKAKRFAALAAALFALASACGAPTPAPSAALPRVSPQATATPTAAPAASGHSDAQAEAEYDERVRVTLERVARVRGLPIRKPVHSRVLDRSAIVERLQAKVEKEIPKGVIASQGEALAALELVPADYDFVGGIFALLGGRIAGYYEPDDGTMYIVDDLNESELDETLSHELVHALQDQSFSLGPMLKYAPGDSDRIAAIHSLVEGDAMAGMLDTLQPGATLHFSEAAMRRLLSASTALSVAGSKAPRVLQASLTAPYADGFALVKTLRERGGWPAVDDIWRKLPQTTEQLLHVDKLLRREPAIAIPAIAVDSLGSGWKVALDDVMGEQGLRMILEDWTSREDAQAAATGWGGDRYIVAEHALGGARRELAVAWHLRMDTPRDATEVAHVLTSQFGTACKTRAALGPVFWKAAGADLVVVAGPYVRDGAAARGGGSCAAASSWAEALLRVKR